MRRIVGVQAGRPNDSRDPSAASIDVTLIDEMLRMTVRQRLEQNERMAALAGRRQAAVDG